MSGTSRSLAELVALAGRLPPCSPPPELEAHVLDAVRRAAAQERGVSGGAADG
jgi:hypothetical protein